MRYGMAIKSAFTDDMDTCIITGRTDHTERHHIFGAFNRKRSEQYGYVVPLHASIHPNGAFCSLSPEGRKDVDLRLKRIAQRHFELHHGSREDFIQEFGRNYLD
jgi:hypothetical protein